MNDKENRPGFSSMAVVGFGFGVLTVIVVLFALKGC